MRTNGTIFLDYQATTPLDPRVYDAMAPFYQEGFGNPHSNDHVIGWRAAKAIDRAREQLSALIGCESDEIIFTSGATESNNLALLGLRNAGREHIIFSCIEHKSIIESCLALNKVYNLRKTQLSVDQNGYVSSSDIEKHLNEHSILSVACTNNEIGTIQNVAQIALIAKNKGAIFHTDAAQALTSTEVTFADSGFDLMSLSAHKMYGPQGIGALIIKREMQSQIQPLLYGGGQQNGLRPGTIPLPLVVGFGKAAELLKQEGIAERTRVRGLRDCFLKQLDALKVAYRLNGPPLDQRHPGNANLCFTGINNQDLLAALQPKVAASTGSACTSGFMHASYVLRSINLSEEDANTSVRFSFGRFTVDEDVVLAAREVERTINRLQF